MRKTAVLLVSVVFLTIGLAACTRSASPDPAQPPFVLETVGGEVESYDRLIGAWNSTEYGEPFVEVSIREGWAIHLRGRCTGAGKLMARDRQKPVLFGCVDLRRSVAVFDDVLPGR